MRRKNFVLKFILYAIFFIIFYRIFYYKKDLNINFESNDYDLFIKNTELIDYEADNLTSLKKLFEKDFSQSQLNIYLNFKNNTNKIDSFFYSKSKKKLPQLATKNNKDFYLILEYTPIIGQTKYCHLNVDKTFLLDKIKNKLLLQKIYAEKAYSKTYYSLLDKCSYKNCLFTCDKTLATRSDALLFHEGDLKVQIEKLRNNFDYSNVYNSLFDFDRDPSQFWILWNDEANPVNKAIDNFKFNWTISYNSKSEVSYCAYGCYKKSHEPLTDIQLNEIVWREFHSRKNSTVWFVSNCKSLFRMDTVAKLGSYYRIELFGKCVSYMKKNYENLNYVNFNENLCKRNSQCDQDAFKNNKFFLAFENQNCSDYITEKFWRSLYYDLIPVVLQPNKIYYERIAPRNSFIHLSDFNYDVEKLSNYLAKVASDINLYRNYFEWKKEYKVMFDGETLEKFRMCELCEKLNNQNRYSHSYYKDLSSWFNNQCKRS